MLQKFIHIFFALLVLGILFSCSNTTEKQEENTYGARKESLEKANRYLVRTELEDIENYIRRHGWNMQETGTGLRYEIYKEGDGEAAEKGRIAVLKYQTWLITGKQVYSSDSTGFKEFKIGKGGVESGLEEAVLLMNRGDKMRLIIPSHLAFGLLGDNNKIPPRSTVVYDIELITLK